MAHWYNSKKASQIAAFLAMKAGGTINLLKAIKLIYLAERRFLDRFDAPMLYDELVSMDHGPVNSITYNLIDGTRRDSYRNEYITDRENHAFSVAKSTLDIEDLDELSRAEIDVLEETWAEFGGFDQWELVDWTHANCPEWEDPHGSSAPIPYSRIFKFLGKNIAEDLDERVAQERQMIRSVMAD